MMELFIGAILFLMLLAIGGVYVELSDLVTHVRDANISLSDNLTSLAVHTATMRKSLEEIEKRLAGPR